jgi:hypothetical protein
VTLPSEEAAMGFTFDESHFNLGNPHSAGQPIRVNYEVDNTGPDDSGHSDYVQVWGSDGTKHLDRYESAPASITGGRYGVFVDVPALQAGYYDISVTLPDGTAAGSTIIVQ